MTQEDKQNRGLAATWVAIALAFAIPLAVLLGFMRGLTSVWRAKWASPGQADAASRYDLGPQSRVSMPGAAPVATQAPPAREALDGTARPAASSAQAEASVAAPAGETTALQVISITSPVERGAVATVDAKAPPNAACTIEYRLPGSGNISNAQGLEPKTADADGLVSWSWTIGRSTTPGAGSITVTCGEDTASAPIEVV